MNLDSVKEKLYDIVAMFFPEATVIWAEQANTVPHPPYVTLKMNGIHRTAFPVVDGDGRRSYHCSTIFEVNLFTRGRLAGAERNGTSSFANTAMQDIMDFCSFVESEEISDIISQAGMDVALLSPVKDLSSLMNGIMYRYRAMAEFRVTFVQSAGGAVATAEMPAIPNSSGGGNADLNNEEHTIEDVDVMNGKEEEKNEK